MARSRRPNGTEINESGHDSFLDIVANLVGILVILIMVLGVRARNAWHTVAQVPEATAVTTVAVPRPDSNEQLELAVEAKKNAVEALQRDTHQLDAQVELLAERAAERKAERDELQLLVAAAKADIEQRTSELSSAEQIQLTTHQKLATSQRLLDSLRRSLTAIETSLATPPEVLHHHPTPLAKTVFGREEHFRLLEGRLVYVPINDIVSQLRSDAEQKLWKMKEADEITETIGPIGGFRVRYTMQRRQRQVETIAGAALHRTIELARFTLFPVADKMGEPLNNALMDGSEFYQFMRRLDPNDTTVTVWTYPDSFGEYRQLKDTLQEMGFQSAARPMPAGHPIGGSPNGSRSAAE